MVQWQKVINEYELVTYISNEYSYQFFSTLCKQHIFSPSER